MFLKALFHKLNGENILPEIIVCFETFSSPFVVTENMHC